MNKAKNPRIFIRVSEFAVMCDIGRTHAYRMVQTGEIKSVRISGALRIPVEALQAYLGSLGVGGMAALNGEQEQPDSALAHLSA